ncbi:hypothetical protein MNBD_PLANCTO03-1666, partial [hydrothermal vent metagenome]
RFTDDQCKRFVRAACKRGWQRHFHRSGLGCLLIVLGLVCFWLAIIPLVWLDNHYNFGRTVLAFVSIFIYAIALGFPATVVIIIRDHLLLRRIRHVLRARGTCPACQYSLLGIVVSAGNIVICPECGIEVEVDESLNELTTDEQGRARFMPTERIEGSQFWTERRKRLTKRVAIGLGVFLFLVLPAGWGGYELFLWQQAKRAAAERPDVAGVLEFVESHQPSGVTAVEPNAFDVLAEVDLLRADITAEVSSRPEYYDEEYGSSPWPDFAAIYIPYPDEETAARWAERWVSRKLAEDLLVAYREGGVFEMLDSLTEMRRAVRGLVVTSPGPLIVAAFPSLGKERELARINGARMHLAILAEDRDEFISAMSANLALGRSLQHQASAIEALAALAIESVTYDRLRYLFPHHPESDWLDHIDAAIRQQRAPLARDHTIEGERVYQLDILAWVFADPSNVRFGRFSKTVREYVDWMASDLSGQRLGTYAENRDSMNAYFDAMAESAVFDPFERPPLPTVTGDLVLLEMLLPALSRILEHADQIETRRRGTAVMIALERHYLAHGFYPDTLSALVPEYLAVLPIDPWTGEPLRYRLHGEGASAYVLYSVGPDAEDNGGQPDEDFNARRDRNPDIILSPPANDASP